jgi:putative flippase GtrA
MIRREIAVFLIVGGLTVVVDFFSYRLFMYAGIGVAIGKALGFLAGTGFAYFANRYWTFAHLRPASSNVARFGALYSATLCVNVVINKLCLEALAGFVLPRVEVAFVVATGCSAILNFLGMKFFVFQSIPTVRE